MLSEEWLKIVEAMGGGLSAVVILGLAFALWSERKRANDMQDKLFEAYKTITDSTIENSRVLDAAIRALRGGEQ